MKICLKNGFQNHFLETIIYLLIVSKYSLWKLVRLEVQFTLDKTSNIIMTLTSMIHNRSYDAIKSNRRAGNHQSLHYLHLFDINNDELYSNNILQSHIDRIMPSYYSIIKVLLFETISITACVQTIGDIILQTIDINLNASLRK